MQYIDKKSSIKHILELGARVFICIACVIIIPALWQKNLGNVLEIDMQGGECRIDGKTVSGYEVFSGKGGDELCIESLTAKELKAEFNGNGGNVYLQSNKGAKPKITKKIECYFKNWQRINIIGDLEKRMSEYIYHFSDAPDETEYIKAIYKSRGKIEIPMATRYGYRFIGWREKGDKDNKTFRPGDRIEIDKDIEMYAVWEPFMLTIEYSAGGGEYISSDGTQNYINSFTFKYGQTCNIAYARDFLLKNDNHSFKSWKNVRNNRQFEEGQYIKRLEEIDPEIGKRDTKVELIAVWEADLYKITLNSGLTDESQIFEKYSIGWFKDEKATRKISRIVTSVNSDQDFCGYYTQPGGKGQEIIDKQGRIKVLPDFFRKDAVIYAFYQGKNNVTYNLNAKGLNGKVPAKQNKIRGEPLELTLQDAEITDYGYRNVYKFLGWSESPDGAGGIWQDRFLKEDRDLELYAQWRNTYEVVYKANGAQQGENYSDHDISAQEKYALIQNDVTRFKKFYRYSESDHEVECSFVGWSTEPGDNAKDYILCDMKEEIDNIELMEMCRSDRTEEDNRICTLYAAWDCYPDLIAKDKYFTLESAKAGNITEEMLLSNVFAEDLEDGELDVYIEGVDVREFMEFEHAGSTTLTYHALDSFENLTEKVVTIHILDSEDMEVRQPKIRFISPEFYEETEDRGGLMKNSIWRTDEEYKVLIEKAMKLMSNEK